MQHLLFFSVLSVGLCYFCGIGCRIELFLWYRVGDCLISTVLSGGLSYFNSIEYWIWIIKYSIFIQPHATASGINAAAGFFSAWYTQATFRKAMRCHGIRVPSPYLYLYDRGAIVIPTLFTIAGANACTCSFEHPPGQYQI